MNKVKLIYEKESYLIRGACYKVYKAFRNTQKESIYQKALVEELTNNQLEVEKAKPFLHKDDISQFWYYLKNSNFNLGFLINFGQPDGVKIVRRVYDTARRA